MDTNQTGIGRMKTANVASRPFLCFVSLIIVLDEFEEGLVRRPIIHLFQQLINFRKEVALRQFAVADAKVFSHDFLHASVVLSQQGPNFRWSSVNKLGPKFHRNIAYGIVLRVNAPTETVPGL